MTMHPSMARSLQRSEPARYIEIQPDRAHFILAYHLSLSISERRARFGVAASDHQISRYVAGIDWRYYRAFGRISGASVSALAELVGGGQAGWQRPELAISVVQDREQVRAELLQIALLAAREQGADDVVISYESNEHWVPALVAELGGTLDADQGLATVPVNDGVDACHAATEMPRIVYGGRS